MITDAVLITAYAVLAILVATTTASFAEHKLHQKLSGAYYGISASLLGWLVVTVVYHLNTAPHLMEYLDNLAFPFIAFLPVTMLLFVWNFYRGNKRFRKSTVALLCIIPAITTVISVVPALGGLLRTGYRVVQIQRLHVSQYEWGPWYYVHTSYSYILMGFCGLLLIRQYKNQPKEYHLPSILMILGIGLTYLSDLPSFQHPNAVVDNTLVGVCLSTVVLYIAIVNNPSIEFLTAARKALYNNMEMPVFILDRQDYMLDMNRAAHGMVEMLGLDGGDASSLTFGDIGRAISSFGGKVTDGFVDDGTSHILLTVNGENVVLNQVRRELADRKGRPLGSYVAMMDVTRLSKMVDNLQSHADIDALTGVSNRRAFEHKTAALDTPENLPLTFIVGDVNKLKQVNDSLGHRHGDKMLQIVAGALTTACPEDGFAARIGGDEFILVIPHCNAEKAKQVVDAINAKLLQSQSNFGPISIALGAVTKTLPEQNVYELIHEADQRMYSQKKYDRRKR